DLIGLRTWTAQFGPWAPLATGSAVCRSLESYLLQRWERMHWQGVDRVLGDPRSHAHERPEIHDWGIHDTLHRELLNAMQEGFAFGFVALDSLLLEEFVNV